MNSGRRSVLTFILIATSCLLGVTLGGIAGGVIGQGQLYQSLAQDKIQRLQPLIADFPELRIECSSAAQVYLDGPRPTAESLTRLTERLILEFGKPESARMLSLLADSSP